MADTGEEMLVSFGIHDALLAHFSVCLVRLSNLVGRAEENITWKLTFAQLWQVHDEAILLYYVAGEIRYY